MLESELDRVEALQQSISATLESGEATPALIRDSCGVSRAIASLSAELRQRGRHVGQILDSLTPEDEDAIAREYLEELPRGRRKAFLELLQSLDTNNLQNAVEAGRNNQRETKTG